VTAITVSDAATSGSWSGSVSFVAGPMTYERADTPCFVCTALAALAPYKHGDRNRMEKCDTDCGEHYDGKHWTVI
jgi:hypothetical protein